MSPNRTYLLLYAPRLACLRDITAVYVPPLEGPRHSVRDTIISKNGFFGLSSIRTVLAKVCEPKISEPSQKRVQPSLRMQQSLMVLGECSVSKPPSNSLIKLMLIRVSHNNLI